MWSQGDILNQFIFKLLSITNAKEEVHESLHFN